MKANREYVFYDGECAMCSRFARLLLERDQSGRFAVAPRDGDTYRELISEQRRSRIPDSVVVLRADGRILIKSEASIYLMKQMGGAYATAAAACRLVPLPVRDFGYGVVAALRKKFGRSESGACPVIPPQFKGRVLP